MIEWSLASSSLNAAVSSATVNVCRKILGSWGVLHGKVKNGGLDVDYSSHELNVSSSSCDDVGLANSHCVRGSLVSDGVQHAYEVPNRYNLYAPSL